MRLPHSEAAFVPDSKVLKYLLNETHPRGKDKAAFFSAFGFSVAEWEVLRASLLAHATDHEVSTILETFEGMHYAIEGELHSPDGRNPLIRSVWIIDRDGTIPRFVTAYPLKREKNEE